MLLFSLKFLAFLFPLFLSFLLFSCKRPRLLAPRLELPQVPCQSIRMRQVPRNRSSCVGLGTVLGHACLWVITVLGHECLRYIVSQQLSETPPQILFGTVGSSNVALIHLTVHHYVFYVIEGHVIARMSQFSVRKMEFE